MAGSTMGALRWNALSLFGKQLTQMLVALIVARVIGPEAYGVIGVATVFVTVATLLMDQGLSAALIQRAELTRKQTGAAVTANLLLALILGGIVVTLAPGAGEFFGIPALVPTMMVLGGGLLLKAPAIVPRALLSRKLAFRPIAKADLASSIVAGVAAIAAALAGASYWAIVIQYLLIDVITAVWLIVAARPPLPMWDLRPLRPLMAFSVRVLASSLLTSVSRNADNVLVGRFLGSEAVGLYALAYRVLMVPVQMLGMMTSRVLFPSFARRAQQPHIIRANMTRVTRVLAFAAIGLMGFVGVAAADGVAVVMGPAWIAAVPVIQILAITGARQAVYSVTAPLMTGLGRADWHLKFAIAATVTQLTGIIAGLPFGLIGVATGYTVAGFVMTPVMIWIQRHLVGESVREHLGAIWPAMLAGSGAIAAYWAASQMDITHLWVLMIGGAAYAVVYVLIVRLITPAYWRALMSDIRSIAAR